MTRLKRKGITNPGIMGEELPHKVAEIIGKEKVEWNLETI